MGGLRVDNASGTNNNLNYLTTHILRNYIVDNGAYPIDIDGLGLARVYYGSPIGYPTSGDWVISYPRINSSVILPNTSSWNVSFILDSFYFPASKTISVDFYWSKVESPSPSPGTQAEYWLGSTSIVTDSTGYASGSLVVMQPTTSSLNDGCLGGIATDLTAPLDYYLGTKAPSSSALGPCQKFATPSPSNYLTSETVTLSVSTRVNKSSMLPSSKKTFRSTPTLATATPTNNGNDVPVCYDSNSCLDIAEMGIDEGKSSCIDIDNPECSSKYQKDKFECRRDCKQSYYVLLNKKNAAKKNVSSVVSHQRLYC